MSLSEYFQQHDGYFWRWEEDGEVLAIPGGNTIAYKSFVADVVDALADDGLPPFGSVLLALAATNANGRSDVDAVYALVNGLLGSANQGREPLASATAFLKLLADLPPKYRQGKNRLLVMKTLFTGCHNRLSAASSKNIVRHFATTITLNGSRLEPQPFYFNLYHEEFTVIKLLSRRFPDSKALLEAMASLPLVEEELPLEKSEDAAGEKDFIESLIQNDKTFHVGSLVRRLWSGLNIPHHNNLPSRQPLGGVSDLTNKGELHRLLISEFANDDVLFLSRLANNEALYLNREVPPQKTELERIVLIDVSLKSWGTPRNVAFAVLLAIAKHPKTDIACSAYAVGEGVHPLKFDSVDDVIESLQNLSPTLHPAQGLETFFKTLGTKKKAEIFFISAAETYRHPALHKTISDHYTSFVYWLHTDAAGSVDLYKRQQNSKRHVQRLQLPLEELWKREGRKVEEKVKVEGEQQKYPILFPAASNPRNTMVTEEGDVYLITSEWSLVKRFKNPSIADSNECPKGWEMVYEGLPHFNGHAEIGIGKDGGRTLLLFNKSNQKLVLLDVENRYSQSIRFQFWDNNSTYQLIFDQDAFILSVKYPHKYWSFALTEDEVRHRMFETPSNVFHHRFLAKELAKQKVRVPNLLNASVFKNVKHVFINELGNIVLNRYELRLNDQQDIVLERTGFLRKEAEAVSAGRIGFRFPDGSTVFVNRSGMLVLKSSNSQLSTIYVPLVVDITLGVATRDVSLSNVFAGNLYFQHPDYPSSVTMSTKDFWEAYITPFIETIKAHGA